MDDLEKKREAVAAEYKLALYRQYTEKQAAAFVGLDYTTLKKKRAKGQIPFIDKGGGNVAYMGFHLADFLLFGTLAVRMHQPPPNTSGNAAAE